MNFLKQNTACEIILGPILDCVDGKTPVETLTLSGITAAIYKGSTRTVITLTASGGDNNLTYVDDGYWKLTLTAGNLDTSGRFKITLRDDDVFLAVVEDFMIQPEAVYNVAPATPQNVADAKDNIIEAIDNIPVTQAVDISGLATQETLDWVKNVLDGDTSIDNTANPWQIVVKNKTTGAELIRKDLKDINGVGITAITKIIAQQKEPS